MERIVVIGGSFGGLTSAFELKRLLRNKADITLVSDSDEFVFIPSLPWLSFGLRKKEDITLPLRPLLERKGIRFVHSPVIGVDADSNKVIVDKSEIPYDFLVISTGAKLAFDEVAGFDPYRGNIHCIFTLEQAQRAEDGFRKLLESPGPVVIGAVQGVSCFGPAYEYVFELDNELRKRRMRNKVPITFVTSEPYVGHFGIGGLKTSRRIMEDEFNDRDIKFIQNKKVSEITADKVILGDGMELPFKMSMLAPAMKGVDSVKHLGNQRGFIPVNEYQRNKEQKNIYTVGVAIAIPSPEKTLVPTGVPKTGFMTRNMAVTAAHAIVSEITGATPPPPFDMDVLCLLDMGDTAAIMRALPALPPREKAYLKKSVAVKWTKMLFEKYYLFKLRSGMTNLP